MHIQFVISSTAPNTPSSWCWDYGKCKRPSVSSSVQEQSRGRNQHKSGRPGAVHEVKDGWLANHNSHIHNHSLSELGFIENI